MPAPADLIHQQSVSTGTGDFTLSAVNGKRAFNDEYGTGGADKFDYFITNQGAAEWERGTGHLSAATTLVRDTVLASSNANGATDFSAGTKDITNDVPAAKQAYMSGISKSTPVDADVVPLFDSAASNSLKELSWANIKATLKSYLDTLYQPLAGALTSWAAITRSSGFDAFAATPSSANLRALLTDEVGTGAVYFVGGALGTPASGTLTNCTGLPISTGVSDLGSGVATFLATPSSANLRAAVTDESGTGALLFANGALGTPASGNLSNCTGIPAPSSSAIASAIAGFSAGGVGTWAFLASVSNNLAMTTGATIAGSSLAYAGLRYSSSALVLPLENDASPSGTWRCMGYSSGVSSTKDATLFLRIS